MAATILVTGVPGNVGTEVARGLAAVGVPFRVAAFQVDAARAALGDDAEVVQFDFLNPATFGAAFDGIERLFLVRPPALANVERDIAPAVRAALAAGVRHIVFLSLQGVEKNRFVPHHKIETLLRESGVAYTFLRASFFMQNLSTVHRAEIRDRSWIDVPVGRARTSFVDVRDIAAVAVRTLTEPGHDFKAYTLTGGEALDYPAVADILSDELNRPVRYINPSLLGFLWRQLRSGRPPGYALIMTMLYTITRLGNASQVTSDVATILGRPPISLRQFAHDHRALWLPDFQTEC